MLRNKLFFVMGLLVIASVILSACGGTAPVATEAPAVVEEPVATEAPAAEEPAAEQTSFTTPHPRRSQGAPGFVLLHQQS